MKLLLPLITSTLIFVTNVLGQCNFRASDNSYNASWYLEPKSSLIRFKIDIQTNDSNFWTGIGFGHSMIGGDFVLATVIGGQVYDVSDRHGIEYGDPIKDARQDIKQVYTKFQDHRLTIAFSRAVDTGDEKDDVPLLDKVKLYCQDFVFPVGGGPTISDPGGAPIRKKHTQMPKIRRICNIDQCVPAVDHTDQGVRKTPIVEHRAGPPAHGPPGHHHAPRRNQHLASRPEFSVDSSPQELASTVSEEAAPFVGQNFNFRSASENQCSFSQVGYKASWIYEPATRSVVFTIDCHLSHNRWASIGFGESMVNCAMEPQIFLTI
uniref:DOMON domain-containing protein n=1 Tax=Romanomermis culicivorax TaxID=13658 RepID=A0A915HIY8_ROMCU